MQKWYIWPHSTHWSFTCRIHFVSVWRVSPNNIQRTCWAGIWGGDWPTWVGPAAAAAAAATAATAAAAWNYSSEEIYAAASLCWRCERASWAEADQMWSEARSGRGRRGGSAVGGVRVTEGGARSRSHILISSRVAVAARSKNTAVPSRSHAAANSRGPCGSRLVHFRILFNKSPS